MHKPHQNAEGYTDLTAYEAIEAVTREQDELNKYWFLIKVLRFIIWNSGFELTNRIELRNRYSGREYK